MFLAIEFHVARQMDVMFLAVNDSCCPQPSLHALRRQTNSSTFVNFSVFNMLSVGMQRSTSVGPILETTGKDSRFARRQVEKTYQQYYRTRKPTAHAKLVATAQSRLQIHNPILRKAIQLDNEAKRAEGEQFKRHNWQQQMWETNKMYFEDKRFLAD